MFSNDDWEQYAVCYDALLSLTPYTDMLKEVVRHIQHIQPARILDASCGTGNLSHLLQDHLPGLAVHGIDRAGSMLDRARMKCSGASHHTFSDVDLDTPLPFATQSFPCITSINTIYAVHDPIATLREFHRVLCVDGTLILVNPTHNYENGLILKAHARSEKDDQYWSGLHSDPRREEQLIREAVDDESTVAALLTVARINRSIATTLTFHFYDPDELIALLESIGFDVQSHTLTYAAQDSLIIAKKGP